MFKPYCSILYLLTAAGFLTLMVGCAQYHHLVPPPPPTTSEVWTTSLTVSIAFLPGDKGLLSLQGGFFLGRSFGGGNTGAIGFGLNSFPLPTSFSFVLYDSLSRNLYGTYALHLAQIYGMSAEGGYTPSIEGDVGIFAWSGDVRQSAEVGLSFMPDITDDYWSRWNVFSSSPRAALIPKVGYNLFAGPVVAGAAWYPGMSRYLLNWLREPENPQDSVLLVPKEQIDSMIFDPNIPAWSGVLTFRLKNKEILRITKRRSLFPQLWARPLREFGTLEELARFDTLQADNYWWVIVDTILVDYQKSETRYDRIMVLDTAAIMKHYRETGELVIRDDTERLRWFENTPIPLTRDLIFSLGWWLPEREEKK